MKFYCPIDVSNSTYHKCIGDLIVFDSSILHGQSGQALLLGISLIALWGIIFYPKYEDKPKLQKSPLQVKT